MKYLFVLLFLVGCGVSAQSARSMSGMQLVSSHLHAVNHFGHADMTVVEELARRGGLSETARAEYARGRALHSDYPQTIWGRPSGYVFAWDRLGYSPDQVMDFYGGLDTYDKRLTIYGPRGSATVSSRGRGFITVR